MTRDEKLRHCHGCENDFYNDKNPLGVKECWSLKSAKLKQRFEIGYWTEPTRKNAFVERKLFQCYHAKGLAYYDALPNFVKRADVIWREKP